VARFQDTLVYGAVEPEGLAKLRDEFDLARSLRGLLDGDEPGASASALADGAIGTSRLDTGRIAPARAMDGFDQVDPAELAARSSVIGEYEAVLTQQAFDRLIDQISGSDLVCFDLETTSLDARHADLVGLSFATQVGQAFYIPVGHIYAGSPSQLDCAEVLSRLQPWFEDPARPKLGQNLKYDAHVLRRYGIVLRGIAHDTLLQSYVLEAHRSHDLSSLAERHLGRKGLSYDDVTGKGASRIGFEQVSVEVATRYSGEDSDFTLHLHQVLWPLLQADDKLRRVYQDIEMPALRVLIEMEERGIQIDAGLLAAQSQSLATTIAQLEAQAHELAGGPFNLGSPKQIGEILFDRLGYKPIKKTAKGAPSTDEDVLEQLAQDYPLPKVLLQWRSLSKLRSTYTDKLPQMIDPATGRVHTTFSQAVAVTGRLASSDPNLQNIPIRTAEGRRIRQAFIAPTGQLLVSADYSQIELRIMAHLSEDPGLLEAFATGQDVHRATAAEIFGVARDEVSDEQRRYAKVINFGLIYGMSAFGLAQNLDIGRDAAKLYIERYFDRYPGVAQYMETIKAQAKTNGYVETAFGRRLWLPEINSPNGPRRAGAERAAINAPMQGTAADLIKMAMVGVEDALGRSGLNARMLLQVHDELIFEVQADQVETLREIAIEVMENVAKLRVPLEVSVGSGPNWDDAH
jgi:DNA polymerase-1